MAGEIEAAGDALTGGLIGEAVERETHGTRGAGPRAQDGHHGPCPNCGAALYTPYCGQCGQAAHLHRSLHSLGHDILHGVFHFEGKIWRTLPELALRPGRLTARYLAGERAKFVSPMALFLFTVFLMFAVFGFTGGALLEPSGGAGAPGTKIAAGDWRAGIRAEYAAAQREVDRLQEQLAKPGLSAAERTALEKKRDDHIDERDGMAAMATGDWSKLAELDSRTRARAARANPRMAETGSDNDIHSGWAGFDAFANKGLKKARENPSLLLYKLKTSGYKYSWLLIPLSIPFLWLLFFWRRDVHLYDHAIFATYSISFMMALTITLSIMAALGAPAAVWGTILLIVPPLHMYRQLRTGYGPSSRAMTLLRLIFLMISTIIVLTLFTLILLALGVLG
ncbi:MAG: DUF3667 domain-containing protein [Sphingobium sp.]|nr:DUF3667 domain-containing protein [Sphingobium sp.]